MKIDDMLTNYLVPFCGNLNHNAARGSVFPDLVFPRFWSTTNFLLLKTMIEDIHILRIKDSSQWLSA